MWRFQRHQSCLTALLNGIRREIRTYEQLKVGSEGLPRDELRISRSRYNAGYSAFLDVLDAQRSVNDAKLALARNRQAQLTYSVDFIKAIGGGWSQT